MTTPKQYREDHPKFPWLSVGDRGGVEDLMRREGWLKSGEKVASCERAGEGNMNLTLRVETNQRTLVLKQARPWVEKYDHIAAPWDRMEYEIRFYERVAALPSVARHMPRLLHTSPSSKTMLIEFLTDSEDLTTLYADASLSADEIGTLVQYLSDLHGETRGEADSNFVNEGMRALNHEHIFLLPLARDNRLDLDTFEAGLNSVAQTLKEDPRYVAQVTALGERYLLNGSTLLHGDFFPGSWLRTPTGIRVIDPEFCFCGDAEFDLGVTMAHMRIANFSWDQASEFLAQYKEGPWAHSPDEGLVSQYAAVEVMRRIMGVAQLPLPQTNGFRAELLVGSRRAMSSEKLEDLWP